MSNDLEYTAHWGRYDVTGSRGQKPGGLVMVHNCKMTLEIDMRQCSPFWSGQLTQVSFCDQHS